MNKVLQMELPTPSEVKLILSRGLAPLGRPQELGVAVTVSHGLNKDALRGVLFSNTSFALAITCGFSVKLTRAKTVSSCGN